MRENEQGAASRLQGQFKQEQEAACAGLMAQGQAHPEGSGEKRALDHGSGLVNRPKTEVEAAQRLLPLPVGIDVGSIPTSHHLNGSDTSKVATSRSRISGSRLAPSRSLKPFTLTSSGAMGPQFEPFPCSTLWSTCRSSLVHAVTNLTLQSHRSIRKHERSQLGYKKPGRTREFLALHARVSNIHQHTHMTSAAHIRRLNQLEPI